MNLVFESGVLILVLGVLSFLGLVLSVSWFLIATRARSEPPRFPPSDPWEDRPRWQGYLETLERDGLPRDHIERLRREGPEVFCRKLRTAVVRGSGNTLKYQDVKCPFDDETHDRKKTSP